MTIGRTGRRRGRLHIHAWPGLLAVIAALSVAGPDSPVADAAMEGAADRVRALVAEGADVNASQGDGMTALHWAARNGDVDLAAFLLESGARVDVGTRIGAYQPLHMAAEVGSGRIVALLLEAGADPEVRTVDVGGATPLHFAAGAGEVSGVQALLDAGAEVDVRERAWGQTPLMFAASRGRTAAVKALLGAGADHGVTSTVIDVAARAVTDRVQRQRRNEAIEAGETWNPVEARGSLEAERQMAEAQRAEAEAVSAAAAEQRMIEEPEPLSYGELVGGHGGLTPLLHAVREGHKETAHALLDGGANVNQPAAGDGTPPLVMAMVNGHYDLGLELVERGADVNLASHAGTTALFAALNTHWAPKSRYPQQHIYMQQDHGYLEVMSRLLEAGADPNARLTKHLWFMSYNFDLLQIDAKGATPFWRAAYALDVDAMRLLVSHGADPSMATEKVPSRRFRRGGEQEDHSGLPPVPVGGPAVMPIHAASGVGYGQGFAANAHRHVPDGWVPAVRYLVEELGADVNARDHDGYAPLHHAAARGDNELIEYLVSKGGDVTVVSRRGQTTVDMANGPVQRIQPFPETIELLEGLGAKNNNNCVSC
ncbi:MAG: hypothetical protein HKO53_07915 [Gemmatimonadetes bacterium]|nr:hypothetical protein [Gemmatimonadota bacterium]